jgi:hypothetical protein
MSLEEQKLVWLLTSRIFERIDKAKGYFARTKVFGPGCSTGDIRRLEMQWSREKLS